MIDVERNILHLDQKVIGGERKLTEEVCRYTGHIGICGPKGYGFWPFSVLISGIDFGFFGQCSWSSLELSLVCTKKLLSHDYSLELINNSPS